VSEITRILHEVEQGQGNAAELLPLIYDELRRLAAAKLARAATGQTLQATALVHEAWLRITEKQGAITWDNRCHFFSAAAEAMRRILAENIRHKQRIKHGGGLCRVDLEAADTELVSPVPEEQLLALNDALDKLAKLDPRAVQLVNLCFFAGLTQKQAGEQMGLSLATAERIWSYARAWLHREITAESTRTDELGL
jgi:RNA polymerase sigma factor (TIGR02999 family)